MQFISLAYVVERTGEAVVGLLDVAFLPVALPKAHPGVCQTWVTFDGTGKEGLYLGAVVRQHIEGLALQVGELLLG